MSLKPLIFSIIFIAGYRYLMKKIKEENISYAKTKKVSEDIPIDIKSLKKAAALEKIKTQKIEEKEYEKTPKTDKNYEHQKHHKKVPQAFNLEHGITSVIKKQKRNFKNPETIRQGIILADVLGPCKAKQGDK